eukprot:5493674-Amphidinium_carterae.1
MGNLGPVLLLDLLSEFWVPSVMVCILTMAVPMCLQNSYGYRQALQKVCAIAWFNEAKAPSATIWGDRLLDNVGNTPGCSLTRYSEQHSCTQQ